MKKTWDITNLITIKLKEDGVSCPVCGGFLSDLGKLPQSAHVVTNTIPEKKIFGKDMVNCGYNRITVCSLECNNRIQIKLGARPGTCREWMDWVQKRIDGNRCNFCLSWNSSED